MKKIAANIWCQNKQKYSFCLMIMNSNKNSYLHHAFKFFLWRNNHSHFTFIGLITEEVAPNVQNFIPSSEIRLISVDMLHDYESLHMTKLNKY